MAYEPRNYLLKLKVMSIIFHRALVRKIYSARTIDRVMTDDKVTQCDACANVRSQAVISLQESLFEINDDLFNALILLQQQEKGYQYN